MKKVLYKILLLLIILATLIFIFLDFKKKINIKSEAKYYTTTYNNKLQKRNKNLSFIKYDNNESGILDKKQQEWTIADNSEISNQERLRDEIYSYIKEKKIEFNSIKIFIEKNNKVILNINDDNSPKLDLQKYQNIVSIQNIIEKNNWQTENIKIEKNDFNNGSNYYSKDSIGASINILDLLKVYKDFSEPVAINVITRFLLQNGETINSGLNKNIDNITNKLEKSIEIFKTYQQQRNRNKTVLQNNNLEEQFFQKTIYSEGEKENYIESKEGFFEVGYVNSTNNYHYAIYLEKNDKEKIVELGYIIDKLINEFETEKNS